MVSSRPFRLFHSCSRRFSGCRPGGNPRLDAHLRLGLLFVRRRGRERPCRLCARQQSRPRRRGLSSRALPGAARRTPRLDETGGQRLLFEHEARAPYDSRFSLFPIPRHAANRADDHQRGESPHASDRSDSRTHEEPAQRRRHLDGLGAGRPDVERTDDPRTRHLRISHDAGVQPPDPDLLGHVEGIPRALSARRSLRRRLRAQSVE